MSKRQEASDASPRRGQLARVAQPKPPAEVLAAGEVGVAVEVAAALDVVGSGLVIEVVGAGCVDADREGVGEAVERDAAESVPAGSVALGVGEVSFGVSGVAGSCVLDLPDRVEPGQKLVPPPDRCWSRLDRVRPDASSTIVTTETIAVNSSTLASVNRRQPASRG